MKTFALKLKNVLSHFVPFLFCMLMSPIHMANANPLEDFKTATGMCGLTEKRDLENLTSLSAESYLLSDTEIDQRRGSSPSTSTLLPATEPVYCLYKQGRKVLVTGITSNYCGWVDESNIKNVTSSSESSFSSNQNLAPCGQIQSMSLKDFCAKALKIGTSKPVYRELLDGCQLESVQGSQIKTKFVTDNTTSRKVNTGENEQLARKKIELVRTPGGKQKKADVNVFSLLEVYDVAIDQSGDINILLGAGGNKVMGWTNLYNGHIWYSRLNTYFKPQGDKSVYLKKVTSFNDNKNNALLASKPSATSFKVDEDFVKFPVLFDLRIRDQNTPQQQKPQLQIAFIGKFCEANKGQMCANTPLKPLVDLQAADVVFLVDGTKSMREYFDHVAKALENFTGDYVANKNYRFGVAMYGDFKSASARELTDDLDFKILMPLKPTYDGNFDGIADASLFIADPSKDKEEPTHAAIYNAVQSFKWKQDKPHYIIHIADHGDRVEPSRQLLNVMLSKDILYFPIAVEGEAVTKESEYFVKHSKIISESYLTRSGEPLANPAIVSYGNGANKPEEDIARALVAVTRGLSSSSSSPAVDAILPEIPRGAKEIFGIPDEDDIEQLAATGFIETAPINSREDNWDYFVSLNANELDRLRDTTSRVCRTLGKSGTERKTVEESLCSFVDIMTGDKTDGARCVAIVSGGSIPLQTRTMLGEGLMSFLRSVQRNENLSVYKKEFCRSSLLTELMQKNYKLSKPEEGQGLLWEGDYFSPVDPEKFKWEYGDTLGNQTYFVPLDYLPRPPEQ